MVKPTQHRSRDDRKAITYTVTIFLWSHGNARRRIRYARSERSVRPATIVVLTPFTDLLSHITLAHRYQPIQALA